MVAESGSFGAALREHRVRRGMTQQAVAELAGVSVRTVQALEQGHTHEPEPATAARIAAVVRLLWPPSEVALPPVRPPAQLPMDAGGFVGRAGQLTTLDALADGCRTIVITGTAGVGKTALGVHWAHRALSRFSDGQLYADLRGYTSGRQMSGTEVAGRFLRAFGLPADQVPAEPEQALVLYQSLLASRKMLVLLDNVASAGQVRDLVPDHPGCLALVTSRDRLDDLEAERCDLDVLDAHETRALLDAALGSSRVGAEPLAADDLATLCGRLPLALRVAAANLADQPGLPIAAHVAELQEGSLLTNLAVEGDAAVRAAFELSYARLSTSDQRLFRLLGLVPGQDFTAEAAAALTGSAADAGLRRLASAHLVLEHSPGRYAFHDLLRLYAMELSLDADVSGLYEWYFGNADAAIRLLAPEGLRLPVSPPAGYGFPSPAEAVAWLDGELANLTAAVTECRSVAVRERAWQIADALRTHYWMSGNGLMWTAAGEAALALATEAGDARAMAGAHFSLAGAYTRINDYARSVTHGEQAVELARRTGWQHLESAALGLLTGVLYEIGDLRKAADYGSRSVALSSELGARNILANSLVNLGNVFLDAGDPEQALEHYQAAHSLAAATGVPYVEALTLAAVGTAHREAGRPHEAYRLLTSAIETMRALGDTAYGGRGLYHLAEVQLDLDDLPGALESAQRAVELAPLGGDHTAEADAHRVLGTVLTALGETSRARTHFHRALALAGGGRSPFCAAKTLIGLGRLDEAAGLARAHGFRGLERLIDDTRRG